MPAALVFDFDGLIVDTETVEYESARRVYADHGVDLPIERWLPIVGAARGWDWMGGLEEAVGHALDRAALLAGRRRAGAELLADAPILPGVVALLDDARAAGVPCAVASNSPAAWVESHLDRLGLTDRFDAVVTVDRVTRGKPDPEPYLLAVAAVGASPAAAVALEDSEIGVAAATTAGLYTVAVPGPMSVRHDVTAADLVVASLEDVDLAALGASVHARFGA